MLLSAGECDEVPVRVRAQLDQGVGLPRAPAVGVRAARPAGLDRRAHSPSITTHALHFTLFHALYANRSSLLFVFYSYIAQVNARRMFSRVLRSAAVRLARVKCVQL